MAMTPKEQLNIIAAHIAGEEIQKTGCLDSTWDKAVICGEGHQFNFADCDYRIKPKPLELWCNVYYGNKGVIVHYSAKSAASHLEDGGRTVHMREVLGD